MRVIVSASVGREGWHWCVESQRAWADRLGAELVIHRETPGGVHPFHAKYDWMKVAYQEGATEVVWVDDDVVVRGDAGWPSFQKWGITVDLIATRRPRGRGATGAARLSRENDCRWFVGRDSYYSSGVMFTRDLPIPELERLSRWSRSLTPHFLPDQAALTIHSFDNPMVTTLDRTWNRLCWEDPRGCYPGLLNHYPGSTKSRIEREGSVWATIPEDSPWK